MAPTQESAGPGAPGSTGDATAETACLRASDTRRAALRGQPRGNALVLLGAMLRGPHGTPCPPPTPPPPARRLAAPCLPRLPRPCRPGVEAGTQILGTAHSTQHGAAWASARQSVSQLSSVARSCPTLRPHEPQHARPPCPSPTPGACSNSCPSSQ